MLTEWILFGVNRDGPSLVVEGEEVRLEDGTDDDWISNHENWRQALVEAKERL